MDFGEEPGTCLFRAFTVESKPDTVSVLEDFVQLSRVLYGICGADLSVAISWGHLRERDRFVCAEGETRD